MPTKNKLPVTNISARLSDSHMVLARSMASLMPSRFESESSGLVALQSWVYVSRIAFSAFELCSSEELVSGPVISPAIHTAVFVVRCEDDML
jgi:hypothetical protein